MSRALRIPAVLLALAGLASVGATQLTDSPPPEFQPGVYLIRKIAIEESVLGAENIETKVYFSAGFTYEPLPKAAFEADRLKRGKNGGNGKSGKRPKKLQPEQTPKFEPSKECKGWMIHVHWTPRVGDKAKLADAGRCRLKGSFAGR